MGCDIHAAIEVRQDQGWFPIDPSGFHATLDEISREFAEDLRGDDPLNLFIGRNYSAFSDVFGVRNYCGNGVAFAANRGIPGDASGEVTLWAADEDAHSPSWVGADELVMMGALDRLDGAGRYMLEVAREHDVHPRDVRLVVWFDN